MATVTGTLHSYLGTDADFQTYIQGVETILAGIGMVQVTQTGELNPLTATRAGASTDAGFRVWRMADTLQATVPVYVKFWFGQASTADRPRIKIDIGTGVDGSGNLTGYAKKLSSLSQFTKSAGASKANNTQTLPYRGSGGEGYAVAAWGIDYTNSTTSFTFLFAVERPMKISTGDPTSEGVLVTLNDAVHFIPGSGIEGGPWQSQAGSTSSFWMGQFGEPSTVSGGNGSVMMAPRFIVCKGRLRVFPATLIYAQAQITEGTTVTVPLWGVNQTYFAMGDGFSVSNSPSGNTATLAVRFS